MWNLDDASTSSPSGVPRTRWTREVMLGVLTRAGHEVVLDPDAADVLVVNTCAFIGPAKEESIDAVLDAARVKAAREGRRLVVTGCLAQRYADDLVRELPEVDAFVGTGDLTRIADAVAGPAGGCPRRLSRGAARAAAARRLSPRPDGCVVDGVPEGLRGLRPPLQLLHHPEDPRAAREPAARRTSCPRRRAWSADGAVELNLIAQDLTAYGRDLARRRHPGPPAARARRAGARARAGSACCTPIPSSVTDELLEVIASEPAVCKYLDMPLQHIADDMLRAMRRERSGAAIRRLLATHSRRGSRASRCARPSSSDSPARPRRTSTSCAPSWRRPSSIASAYSATRRRRARTPRVSADRCPSG